MGCRRVARPASPWAPSSETYTAQPRAQLCRKDSSAHSFQRVYKFRLRAECDPSVGDEPAPFERSFINVSLSTLLLPVPVCVLLPCKLERLVQRRMPHTMCSNMQNRVQRRTVRRGVLSNK